MWSAALGAKTLKQFLDPSSKSNGRYPTVIEVLPWMACYLVLTMVFLHTSYVFVSDAINPVVHVKYNKAVELSTSLLAARDARVDHLCDMSVAMALECERLAELGNLPFVLFVAYRTMQESAGHVTDAFAMLTSFRLCGDICANHVTNWMTSISGWGLYMFPLIATLVLFHIVCTVKGPVAVLVRLCGRPFMDSIKAAPLENKQPQWHRVRPDKWHVVPDSDVHTLPPPRHRRFVSQGDPLRHGVGDPRGTGDISDSGSDVSDGGSAIEEDYASGDDAPRQAGRGAAAQVAGSEFP